MVISGKTSRMPSPSQKAAERGGKKTYASLSCLAWSRESMPKDTLETMFATGKVPPSGTHAEPSAAIFLGPTRSFYHGLETEELGSLGWGGIT